MSRTTAGQVTTGPTNPPTRRGTELALLLFAVGIIGLAFVLACENQTQSVGASVGYYVGAYLILVLVMHFAVRRFAPYADPLILPCLAFLTGLGVVMLYRLDFPFAQQAASNGKTYADTAPRQLMWMAVATVVLVVVLWALKDHRTLARYGYTCGLAGLVLLVLPGMLPYSISGAGGAKLWLRFGPIQVQPGEFAKVLIIIFVAAFLVSKRDLFTIAGRRFLGLELPRARDTGPLLVAWAVAVVVLMIEKELGMSLMFFGTMLVMVYLATERAAWVWIGLVLFIGGCVVADKLFTHVQQRVANWIDPFATYGADGGGFQMAQSLFSLGSGGIAGAGFGAGHPEQVPVVTSDFIIAAIGEELGFIGLTAVILVYLLLAMRGMRGALAVRDTFGKLLGGGLAFLLGLQVFVVVGGVSKLIPQTGLTAPFLSAGGSSLVANFVLVALLLRISDAARKPQPSSPPRPAASIAEANTVLVERPSS